VESLRIEQWLVLGGLLLAATGVGFLAARLYSYFQSAGDKSAGTDKDQDSVELRRALRRMEQENNAMTLFFVTVPDLIRQLQSNRDKRQIAPLMIRLLEVIFEPTQICVFYRSVAKDSLKLAASKGLHRAVEDMGLRVNLSEGRIGWVAEHQVVMDSRDFSSAQGFRGEEPGLTSRIQIDLCAPMIDPDDNRTIGIITVGGLGRYPRNDKKMIKMAADLGSMGIKNAEYHKRIQTLANEDSLTKLYNKRFGRDNLALFINDAEKSNRALSIYLLDIDHFKNYNDTNGHLAGDEVLRQIGRLLLSVIRADDFAVRFGGEEFLVVFQETDKEGALMAAEKIRRQVEGYPFPFQDRQPGGNLTVSGGVAAFRTDAQNSTDLIRLADEALYEAKRQGRNRVIACRTPYLSAEGDTFSDDLPSLPT
jgi:diguanylate cyclase (GGDEF)-like protein